MKLLRNSPPPLLALLLWALARPALAQSPTIDPNFAIASVYAPGQVRQVLVQPDGKVLVLGYFTRFDGTAVPGLMRLLPGSNQLDATFQTNVGIPSDYPDQLLLLPDGKILLLANSRSLQVGNVVRYSLLRLNADGSPDASFDTGSSAYSVNALVAQPDGKVLIGGSFSTINGQAVGNVVRLNADGSVDAAFQATGAGPNGGVTSLALQADGGILVGGSFTAVHGQARGGLARLLPSGALDPGFLPPAGIALTQNIAVLPSGNSVAVVTDYTSYSLLRLLPNGSRDPQFLAGTLQPPPPGSARGNIQLTALASGAVLVACLPQWSYNGSPVSRLFRVLPSGLLDPTFANATAVRGRASGYSNTVPVSVAPLPNGQLLVGSNRLLLSGLARPVGLGRLNANGSADASFGAVPLQEGSISDMALQPDGKMVVGGNFVEINGTSAGFLARLDASGAVEPGFTAAAGGDDMVSSLALQPDGKVLVGGYFDQLAGGAQARLARLLPVGTPDGAFAPAMGTFAVVNQVVLQPNGQVLATDNQHFMRFAGTSGARDMSFRPADTVNVSRLLVLPSGSIVVSGARRSNRQAVWQLLPTGAEDVSFVSAVQAAPGLVSGSALAPAPGGGVYLARFLSNGGSSQREVVRLLPNGSIDPTFSASAWPGYSTIRSLVVQPNGRLLLGGFLTIGNYDRGSLRLLPTGGLDTSYDPARGPTSEVTRILVQPDGKLLMAGSFNSVDGLPVNGLTRLLDPNVLALRPGSVQAALQAWPVPAHGLLHLQLSAAAGAYTATLLDVTGRTVLTQNIGATATLPLAGVAPGVYLLRCTAADGTAAARRIVVE